MAYDTGDPGDPTLHDESMLSQESPGDVPAETIPLKPTQETLPEDLDEADETVAILKPQDDVRKSQVKLALTPQMLLLYAVVMADAMVLTIISPFVPQLLRERFQIPEDQVGVLGGLLMGSFHFARFLSAFFIGYLSDLFGRKKLIVLGLLSSATSTMVVAIAPNYAVAFFARAICGLLNSNAALAKAALSDMTVESQRAMAFALVGATFGISRASSSSITGLTTGIMIPNSPWEDNPYFLPCVIGSSLQFFVLIPFLCCFSTRRTAHDPETAPSALESGHVASEAPAGPPKPGRVCGNLREGLSTAAQDKTLRIVFWLNSATSFGNGSILMVLILISQLPTDYNGAGASPSFLGGLLAYFGVCVIAFQLLLFKPILSSRGLRGTFKFGTRCFSLACILIPACAYIQARVGADPIGSILTKIAWLVALAVMGAGFQTALTITGTMISNATLDRSRVGLTQGTGQSLASLARSIGPMTSGGLFSLCVQYHAPFIPFMFLAALYFSSSIIVGWLGPHIERDRVTAEQEMAAKALADIKSGPKTLDDVEPIHPATPTDQGHHDPVEDETQESESESESLIPHSTTS